ncbi:MAG: hypothetical protein IJN41_09000, partial [Firmicutes bacterium]|nr:hypothetical protein [Bacillota bacterium]
MMSFKVNNQKYLVLLLALILAALLCAPVAVFAEGEEEILPEEEMTEPVRGTYVAVGIKYESSAVSKVDMYSDDGFQIVDISDGIVETLPLTGYTHLVITSDNGLINVSDENGATLVTDLGKNGVIMNGD